MAELLLLNGLGRVVGQLQSGDAHLTQSLLRVVCYMASDPSALQELYQVSANRSDVLLVYCWCTAGVHLVYCWFTAGVLLLVVCCMGVGPRRLARAVPGRLFAPARVVAPCALWWGGGLVFSW